MGFAPSSLRGSKRPFSCTFLVVPFAALLLSASCATSAPARLGPTPLIADPSIDSGRLENGLAFSFKENRNPRDRLMLRLVVKVGSLDERDDELGAAHFVEHMAFRGTKSFPGDSLIKYMESIGMTVGAEVNARTGYDSTEFRLEVPSDDREAVHTAFAILRDWADGILFDPAAVEDERRVVLEEERHSRGPGDRVWKTQLPAVYGDSLYARSVPIGRPEVITTLDAAKLKSFYERWYRPQLMSVIAVGDLPVKEMEQSLREAFGSLGPAEGPATAARSVPEWSGTRVSIARDPELNYGSLELGVRLPLVRARTEEQFGVNAEQAMALALLQNRFLEVVRRSGGKTLRAVAFDEAELADNYMLLTATASFEGAAWSDATHTLMAELARVAKRGYSEEEIQRVQSDYLVDLEDWRTNGLSSAEWSARLASSSIKGIVPISIDDRLRYYRVVFRGVSRSRLASYAGLFRESKERVVLLSMPDTALPSPSPEELTTELMRQQPDLGPWGSSSPKIGIMDRLPDPEQPVALKEMGDLGLMDLRYANGLRVILKPTKFKNDEIAVYGMALRGTDALSVDGYANLSLCSSLIPASGFPGLPADALKLALSGKHASLVAGVDETESYLRGSSDRASLELLLQLIHRTMSEPAVDPGYFSALKQNTAAYGRNFPNIPNRVLQQEIMKQLYPGDPRKVLFSRPEDASHLDRTVMRDSFVHLFGSANGFTFCFTGSFDPLVLRALCDRYLGSLPAGSPPESSIAASSIQGGSLSKTISIDNAEKATVVLIYKTPSSDTDPTTVDGLTLLSEALRRRLREEIRVAAGGSYDPGSSARTYIDSRYSLLDISFDASPARAAELTQIVERVVDNFRTNGVPQSEIDQIVLAFKQQLETAANNNAYLARRISWSATRNLDLDPVKATIDRLTSITTDWTRSASQRYLNPDNLLVFTMLPKKK